MEERPPTGGWCGSEAEKPAAFRPLSLTPAQLFYFLDLPMRLLCAVAAVLSAKVS